MKNFYFKRALIIYSIAILQIVILSCAKEKETRTEKVDVLVETPVNPWTTFDYQSISSASDIIKKVADSTVFIATATSSGSGFLIEYKNQILLITNEHVLGRSLCTIKGCAGFKAVRGFYPSGPNQVFTDILPIIQSTDLDFSVFITQFKVGEIPTLKVAKNLDDITVPDFHLTAIGHPEAAPTKFTSLLVKSSSQYFINTSGGLWHGNSGGPVINSKNGEVVGIVSMYSFPNFIAKNGFFEKNYVSKARKMDYILYLLDQLSQLSTPLQVKLRPPENFDKMKKDSKWFVAIGWKSKDPIAALELSFPKTEYISSVDRVESILEAYHSIYKAFGELPLLTTDVSNYLKIKLDSSLDKLSPNSDLSALEKNRNFLKENIRTLSGSTEKNLSSCINEAKDPFLVNYLPTAINIDQFWNKVANDLLYIFPLCLNTENLNLSPFLLKYGNNLSLLKISSQQYLVGYLANYIEYKYPSPWDAHELLPLLNSIISTADSLYASFYAESISHIINNKLNLLGKGWLKDTSEIQIQKILN